MSLLRNISLLWRLYAGFVVVTLLFALVLSIQIGNQIEKNNLSDIEESLRVRGELMAKHYEDGFYGLPHAELQRNIVQLGEKTGTRITLIEGDGTVIADSHKNPAVMDNHIDRPEIQQSITDSAGRAARFSDTIEENMLYFARHLSGSADTGGAGFVRVSVPTDDIDNKVAVFQQQVYIGVSISLLISLLLGFYISKRFSSPIEEMTVRADAIAKGDYSQRIKTEYRGEIGKLARAFDHMAGSAEKRFQQLISDRNKLATILSGMVEGVIAIDHDDNIIHMNEAAARMLAVSSTLSIGKSFWQVVTNPEIHSVLDGIASDKGGVKHKQINIPGRINDAVVDVYAASIDVARQDKGAVLVLHDVSELYRLERVRRDFVVNASHELKTPITAIRGVIETIIDDEEMEAEVQREFLSRIQSQTERLSSIVTDLMALSRLESGERENQQRLTLNAIIAQSVKAFQAVAVDQKIDLRADIPEQHVRILGDPQSIGQLFDNLIDNAIKYNQPGGCVCVKLTCDDTQTEISIEDNGKGIREQDITRIFERFYRVDKGRSRELGGTGLGLAIVKHIVESHEGTIAVQSEYGSGTTFTIVLPLA